MGQKTDKKQEEKGKKRKKERDSDSDSDEHRKHKHSDEHRKHKHKDKKHKKDKDKKRDAAAEEKRRVKEAKKFLKQHLKQDGGAQPSGAPGDNKPPPPDYEVTPISEEDYFAKNPEFSSWLRDCQRVHFNELAAEDARERFKEFVALWNGRKLPVRLYRGVDGGALRRTQHAWGRLGTSGAGPSGAVVRGMAAAAEEEREAAAAAAAGRAVERRKWKEEQKQLLDEMLPPPTAGTRDARIEAKAARRDEARAREASPDVVHLPGGGDAMGLGDGDSFAAAKAREAAAAARRGRFGAARAEEAARRMAEYGQKEDNTMAQFRALLDRGPIAIPKRS